MPSNSWSAETLGRGIRKVGDQPKGSLDPEGDTELMQELKAWFEPYLPPKCNLSLMLPSISLKCLGGERTLNNIIVIHVKSNQLLVPNPALFLCFMLDGHTSNLNSWLLLPKLTCLIMVRSPVRK